MPFQRSQEGQIGIITQPVEGTYTDPGTGGVFFRTTGGSLVGDTSVLVTEAEIGGNRDRSAATLSVASFGGDYEMYTRFNILPTLLKGALGSGTSASQNTGE